MMLNNSIYAMLKRCVVHHTTTAAVDSFLQPEGTQHVLVRCWFVSCCACLSVSSHFVHARPSGGLRCQALGC
jgi:hypothetical protein